MYAYVSDVCKYLHFQYLFLPIPVCVENKKQKKVEKKMQLPRDVWAREAVTLTTLSPSPVGLIRPLTGDEFCFLFIASL